jgi:riboflavin kinase / FMN adenylyltransferase
MQVIRDALHSTDLPYGGVATIGNYDGIHRGQRQVIAAVVERARALAAPPLVISFDPHPKSVLRPSETPLLLTSASQREALLAELGVEALLLVKFTREFARTGAENFVREFLSGQLAIQEILVGQGFAFGRDRQGTVELLRQLGNQLGFATQEIPPVLHHGEPVSSTRVRQAVGAGQVEAAMELLGRPFALRGKIVRGDRMGKRLGWPTINLVAENGCLPTDGVYTTQVLIPTIPATFDSVTNIGTRPTVYENCQRVVESHILGFNSDVYGETVEILFYKRLRDERIFPTVMDLSAQLSRDVEATREYFALRKRLEH